ncbi:MAG TPA: YolD-like family protein [Candidatus Avamphibacillus intestinigallinarum]|nr:YolD-like family protein [Candidatus Avamphibacillus intestinigallinarum]
MNKLSKGSNMMWESSRMMIPEHKAALNQMHQQQKKLNKTILDEQEKEILNDKLHLANTHQLTIQIDYFKDGWIEQAIGKIKQINIQQQTLHLQDAERTVISFENLLKIDILS